MKKGKWTIVVDDKRIIKQYGDGIGIGYEILDNNFWSNLDSNICAIQYTGDSSDYEQVEYRTQIENSFFEGNIKNFADKWDEAHLLKLQSDWDINNIYELVPNTNITPENPFQFNTVKKEETIEQKTTRIGPRPSVYVSENIY
jgi:hypothetical protein